MCAIRCAVAVVDVEHPAFVRFDLRVSARHVVLSPSSAYNSDMADGALEMVRKTVSAGQVFAEPIERDGTTVIGVARIFGGGGGGERLPDGSTGGGLGLIAGPVGAYVIRDGRVRWIPAVDANRLVVVVAVLGVVILVRRARRRRRAAAVAAAHPTTRI
jgi:uncharacterized spore protein YtfJ